MSARFHPHLVNEPFGDPGLFVEFMFEKRAILFDLGELTSLGSRKILRVREAFVSHMHLDHFCGFDRLLRVLLGRNHTLRLFGPQGLVDAVSHKLAAYTWNLVDKYTTDLTFIVGELRGNDRLRIVEFKCRSGFRQQGERLETVHGGRLLDEESFCVRTAVLDHGIACLAFALEERVHINIWKNQIEELGVGVGAWLRDLKEAILRNDPDDTPIMARWNKHGRVGEKTVQLGALRERAVRITPGIKIAYVVDAVGTPENIEKIVALAQGANVLYIESPFLHEDEARARHRYHLTARQAGEIARAAQVQRCFTLHYSPRYEGRGEELVREAERAFLGDGNG
jgi:ribonuclease Z